MSVATTIPTSTRPPSSTSASPRTPGGRPFRLGVVLGPERHRRTSAPAPLTGPRRRGARTSRWRPSSRPGCVPEVGRAEHGGDHPDLDEAHAAGREGGDAHPRRGRRRAHRSPPPQARLRGRLRFPAATRHAGREVAHPAAVGQCLGGSDWPASGGRSSCRAWMAERNRPSNPEMQRSCARSVGWRSGIDRPIRRCSGAVRGARTAERNRLSNSLRCHDRPCRVIAHAEVALLEERRPLTRAEVHASPRSPSTSCPTS